MNKVGLPENITRAPGSDSFQTVTLKAPCLRSGPITEPSVLCQEGAISMNVDTSIRRDKNTRGAESKSWPRSTFLNKRQLTEGTVYSV